MKRGVLLLQEQVGLVYVTMPYILILCDQVIKPELGVHVGELWCRGLIIEVVSGACI